MDIVFFYEYPEPFLTQYIFNKLRRGGKPVFFMQVVRIFRG